MRPDILIIGQGIAGTTLAWELEQAGISFAIVDDGHANAATSAAAGIINPVTGRRLVKSWRYETQLPVARESYQAMGAALNETIWHDMRIRREFVDERERAIGNDPKRQAELADYLESADERGWWLKMAGRVDLPRLLAGMRERWRRGGQMRTESVELVREMERQARVIDCRGVAGTDEAAFRFVPWEYSKGEVIELAVDGLEPGVVLNRRIWVLTTGAGKAIAGATHEPGLRDVTPTGRGRDFISEGLRAMLPGVKYEITGHRAGVRVNLPDKRPVAGRHPELSSLGLVNGLGAKGALWAPTLAKAWVEQLMQGRSFDAEFDVARFAGETWR
jgi:glycine oxidase